MKQYFTLIAILIYMTLKKYHIKLELIFILFECAIIVCFPICLSNLYV